MGSGSQNTDKRPLLFISNRWVNTIYTGYGVIKQRILLQVIESLQDDIKKVMRGKRVSDYNFPAGSDVCIHLDMSKVAHYNNYHWVRKAIKEMSEQPIQIYNDASFKSKIYLGATLLNGFDITKEKKVVALRIKKNIAELLIHVDFKQTKKPPFEKKAQQFTQFDAGTISNINYGACKYRLPLYLMICSYAEKGGFTIDVDELRTRLQVEEKYKGFDNFHRHILKHVQKELQIFGAYGFNFSLVKTGKVVKKIVFKVFANQKYDPNHVWIRLQRALTQDLPYFVRFTEEQREQFNYLLTGKHDLDVVLTKFQYIHKALVKNKEQGNATKSAFAYTLSAIHNEFPPG